MNKLHHSVILETVMTCPSCHAKEKQTMWPHFIESVFVCNKCNKPHLQIPDRCCIYCSYGSIECPPIQEVAYRLANNNK